MLETILQYPFMAALTATFFAGFLMTAAGAVPVLFIRNMSERLNNNLLSFAAGVMLAATIFSLLLPAIEEFKAKGFGEVSSVTSVIAGLFIGALVLTLVHKLTPHEHFLKGMDNADHTRLSRIWLFVFAITLHNFPEGLSIGVAAASGDASIGLGATVGIGLQNFPEGLSVAVALISQGYSRLYSFGIAALTGVVEIAGGMVGAGVLTISFNLLPWALAASAGAMLWVVSDEIIPETHRPGFEGGATYALFAGFGLMMFLDSVFAV